MQVTSRLVRLNRECIPGRCGPPKAIESKNTNEHEGGIVRCSATGIGVDLRTVQTQPPSKRNAWNLYDQKGKEKWSAIAGEPEKLNLKW